MHRSQTFRYDDPDSDESPRMQACDLEVDSADLRLARVTNMRPLPSTVVLESLRGLPVIGDLFVDMTGFFKRRAV